MKRYKYTIKKVGKRKLYLRVEYLIQDEHTVNIDMLLSHLRLSGDLLVFDSQKKRDNFIDGLKSYDTEVIEVQPKIHSTI